MGAKVGHTVSPETRAKISAALKGRGPERGRPVTPETRAKISDALKGRPLSESHREKMRGRTGESSSAWRGDEATPEAKHMWLVRHHPKSGVCEDCGERTATQYAFLHHPALHTRDRDDYRELCDACHRRFDKWLRKKH